MSHALLDAIAAAPHEDTPRLVLADWLDEQGDLWGPLLQLDCRIASLPRFDRERRRLARLRRAALAAWKPSFWPAFQAAGVARARIQRGFVHAVELADFPAAGLPAPALLDEVTVSEHAPRALYQLQRSPAGARVERLRIDMAGGSLYLVARALIEGPGLPALRALRVPRGRSSDAWRRLVGTGLVARLDELEVDGGADLATIAASLRRGRLRRLAVVGGAAPDGVRALLAAAPHLRALELTALERGPELDQLLGLLAGWQHTSLARLCLRGVPDARVASAALSRIDQPALRVLELERIDLLAGLPRLPPQLERLALRNCRIGDAGAAALAAAVPRSLVALDLADNRIGPEGVRALLGLSLAELELGGNPIGDEGAFALAEAELPRLVWLGLDRIDMLSFAGVEALIQRLPEQRTLAVPDVGIPEQRGVVVAPPAREAPLDFSDAAEPDLAGV